MLLRIGIVVLMLGIIGGVASAIAWRAGDDDHRTVEYRIVSSDQDAATGQTVVLVDRDNWRGGHFFPFFPFLVIGGILIALGVFGGGGRRWDRHQRFEDWHRDAHHGDPPPTSTGGAAS